ncbi:GntR family transcriptional regulator [Jiangella rhizosphaerae]|uniref:GntR family transcriptional regulator n=1 Tax=Jiangella rhizosphaerae TaxID=2293569 RepID=A0A418KGE1_9ACTN|nr:GntR family transcriptional regulator [Jiangella rhizosphaerae]RIQ11022.1 GntR family transcriptional regulator [Jiangella rhizosphaerae]
MPHDDRTLAQSAYSDIRAMIVGGELPPGTKLIVRLLSERLGLSATPIKSALAALERDGFLVAIPHRGFHVPRVGPRDMLEIYELREMLDGVAARRVARSPSAAELVRTVLDPLLAQQREHGDDGDLAGLRDLDAEFHRAIWHASGNGRLAVVGDNLSGQVRLAWSGRPSGGIARTLREHEAIAAAIAAGDPARAERASRAHVRRSVVAYERALVRPDGAR